MRSSAIGVLLLLGCEGMVSTVPPDWRWDGGFDEEPDSGSVPVVMDAGLDAGATEADSGVPFDAGVVPDAGRDAGAVDAGPTSLRHTPRPLYTTDAGNGFYEYLPPGYGDGEKRPMLVFWHGIGENGKTDAGLSDLQQVVAHGPPALIQQNRWSNGWPFVVLSPQHRGGGCPGAGEIRDFIAWGAANYDVDPKRLYLTGLSCGAIGAWSYLGANLDSQVAAAVLICGDPGDPNNAGSVWGRNMCNLGRVPIWSFHGDSDSIVNIANNRETMNRLIACPAPPRKDAIFTVYPMTDHGSWSQTYDLSAGHDVYSWLLRQAKP